MARTAASGNHRPGTVTGCRTPVRKVDSGPEAGRADLLTHVSDRADEALQRLLIEDPRQGWTMFVDTYTPTLLALIERSGVTDRDDALDVYVRVRLQSPNS